MVFGCCIKKSKEASVGVLPSPRKVLEGNALTMCQPKSLNLSIVGLTGPRSRVDQACQVDLPPANSDCQPVPINEEVEKSAQKSAQKSAEKPTKPIKSAEKPTKQAKLAINEPVHKEEQVEVFKKRLFSYDLPEIRTRPRDPSITHNLVSPSKKITAFASNISGSSSVFNSLKEYQNYTQKKLETMKKFAPNFFGKQELSEAEENHSSSQEDPANLDNQLRSVEINVPTLVKLQGLGFGLDKKRLSAADYYSPQISPRKLVGGNLLERFTNRSKDTPTDRTEMKFIEKERGGSSPRKSWRIWNNRDEGPVSPNKSIDSNGSRSNARDEMKSKSIFFMKSVTGKRDGMTPDNTKGLRIHLGGELVVNKNLTGEENN